YHLFLRPTAPTALFSLSLHDALPIFASMQSNPDATAQTPHLEVVQEYVMLRDQVRSKMLGAGYKSTGNSPTSEFRQTELYKVWMDAVEDMKRRSSTFSEIYTRARLEQDNLASDPLAAYREGGE